MDLEEFFNWRNFDVEREWEIARIDRVSNFFIYFVEIWKFFFQKENGVSLS